MSHSDPIADFLTRIRNALKAQHRYLDLPWSRIKQNIAEILKKEGLIENYIVKHEKPYSTMRLMLKYAEGRKSVIQGVKRVSKPGLRRYVNHEEIPHFYGNLGISIVSTSHGVMTGSEAYKRRVGGELLCLVW